MNHRGLVAILVGLFLFASACTKQQRAKNFGGTARMDLPPGRKLITATWKENDHLWYLHRQMRADEQPETYEFAESSNFGILQGKVIIAESR